jgi:hypothetical protein
MEDGTPAGIVLSVGVIGGIYPKIKSRRDWGGQHGKRREPE